MRAGTVAKWILYLWQLSCTAKGEGEADLVSDLPGLIFETNFDTYSGYLNADTDGALRMHYWLIESRSDPSTDPLLVWFQGGPGCSALVGSFAEIGPFYVNRDSATLYENIYSWNQKAVLLFIESPIGVGFSYDRNRFNSSDGNDDEKSADQNYAALLDFFSRVQRKYIGRTFFIAGTSYSGIFIPMLASRIVDGINDGQFVNPNFQGIAIGNGYLNEALLMNSLIVWSNYHARVSIESWERIKQQCCNNSDVDDCDFYAHLRTTNHFDFTSDGSECGDLITPLLTTQPDVEDGYNYYENCYTTSESKEPFFKTKSFLSFGKLLTSSRDYTNTAEMLNYDSTDSQSGYPCWQFGAINDYVNTKSVIEAFRISNEWKNRNATWDECNAAMSTLYNATTTDTTPYFQKIVNNIKTANFRILIYNGDVDTVCNYLGDAWHIRNLAKSLNIPSAERQPWQFRGQYAGYYQRYTNGGNSVSIDVLTVKGGGHFSANDRPGPVMQMITNFMWPGDDATVNYSSTANVNDTPKPAPLIQNRPSTEGNSAGTSLSQSLSFFSTALPVFMLTILFSSSFVYFDALVSLTCE